MNTLSIVILALNGAVSAIGMAEGFITNTTIIKVMDDVRVAIQFALGALQPHLEAAQAHAREQEGGGSKSHAGEGQGTESSPEGQSKASKQKASIDGEGQGGDNKGSGKTAQTDVFKKKLASGEQDVADGIAEDQDDANDEEDDKE